MIVPPSPSTVAALAVALMALGLIGAVVPVVPGPILIWLGAFIWAWNDGFRSIGWPTLLALGILVIIGWGLDLFFTSTISRRAGASWRSVAVAIVSGFAGGLFGTQIVPIVGSVLGAAIGASLGMIAAEFFIKRRWRTALRSSGGYLMGCAISKAAELVLALAMIGIFAWQAFFSPA